MAGQGASIKLITYISRDLEDWLRIEAERRQISISLVVRELVKQAATEGPTLHSLQESLSRLERSLLTVRVAPQA